MTEAKSSRRRRRSSVGLSIPPVLAEWFAGERVPGPRKSKTPWLALMYPHGDLLSMRWKAWKEADPDAKPLEGYEWLDDPDSTRHRSEKLVARALACLNRGPAQ
jgi:hypothetical protein